MKLLIKSVKVVWENSEFHNQVLDIYLEGGKIHSIGHSLSVNPEMVWESKGSFLSPGWFDLDASFGDPGYEMREDLQSGAEAARRGGFTGIGLMPNTHPPFHSKGEIDYILTKSKELPLEIHPIGTISKNRDGKEMAELFDMFQTGARAFSDGDRVLENAGLLLRALQYTAGFGGRIFSYPEDHSLSGNAQVHEGLESLVLGMKGIPSLAEELMIVRDLLIAAYAGTPIHFTSISSKEGVELIRKAKERGQAVTAAVPSYHLYFTDEDLRGFDTNFKVRPPLRSKEDRESLIKGILDGTLDAITSRHRPHEIESKAVEFELALDGMINLETSFSLSHMGFGSQVPIDKWIGSMSQKPREILGLKPLELKIGEEANLTWFHPGIDWIYDQKESVSKSVNSPLLGKKLQGKVLGVISKNQISKF